MNENKKRVRPTLAKERELAKKVETLEKKLEEQYEALHLACQESNGWRDRYRVAKKDVLLWQDVADKRMQEILSLRNRSPWKAFLDWVRG